MFKPNGYWQHRMVPGVNGDNGDDVGIGYLQGAVFIVIIFVMFALCAILGSCTTTEYVTVEKVRTDTVRVNHTERDSIYLHDSVYVKEWMKGDTVYRDVDRWHTKYVESIRHDTVYKSNTDTVQAYYEVVKEVPQKLSKWEKNLMAIGFMAIIGIVVFIIYKIKKILPI